MHAICLRYLSYAASRTAKHRCKLSDDTHMNGVRSSQNVLGPCLCVLPSTKSQSKTQEAPEADPPHQQESRGQAENFSSHGLFTHLHVRAHTHTHTHSYTDTVIQCPPSQPLASSRCLKTGATSVLGSPSSPLPLATFVGKRLAVKGKQQTQSQLLCPHHHPNTKYP